MDGTGYRLIDDPPASPQYGPRNESERGCVVVHTPESFIDVRPPDNGAENVATFIGNRSDAGSYHELVDSDSFVRLIPDHLRAFHVAAAGVNHWSWSISFATQAAMWGTYPAWDAQALRRGGERIAAYAVRWAQRRFGDPNQARRVAQWITANEAYGGEPGLIHHGQFQLDRTDAWEHHPLRAMLDGTLLDCVNEALNDLLVPEAPQEAEPMTVIVRGSRRYMLYPTGLMIEAGTKLPTESFPRWEPDGEAFEDLVIVNEKVRAQLGLDTKKIPRK